MSKNWPTLKLGEVLAERNEVPSETDLFSGNVQIVEKIGFNEGRIKLRTDSQTKTGMILIRPGDLVVSGINAAKGAIAIYEDVNEEPIAATIHYGAYIPNKDRVEIKFLWWMLRSKFFRELLLAYVPGGIKTELKAKRLLPIPIPLPPLAEQRRIVARIKELTAKIEETRGLRKQAAVETEALLSSAVSRLCRSSKWDAMTVGELVGEGSLRNGKSVKSTGTDGEIHCLTLSAVRNGRIDLRDSKVVPLTQEEAKSVLVHRGDVFVVRGNGSKNLCGMAGLVTENSDSVIFPDLFIHVPLPESRMLPEFFVAVWNSGTTREVIEEKAKTTSGIWKINQGHIASTVVPVPPLPEQRRTVAYLEDLQRQTDTLKALQAETSAELDALMPSILDKAFRAEM